MRRPLLVPSLELLAALALVVAQHALFRGLGLREHLLDYGYMAAERVNAGEAKLFAIQLALGIPAALAIADALRRLGLGALGSIGPRRARWIAAGLAIATAFGALLVTRLVLRGAPLTDDENTYVFQARALLGGGFTAPAPTPRGAFLSHFFVVPVEGHRWAGVFFPGQPLLLTIGVALGDPHLTQYLCAGLLVWLAARFADERWGVEASVVTAVLLATSPLVVFAAATLHNVVPVMLFGIVALRAAAKLADGKGAIQGAVLGAACGAAFLVRPLDGVVLAAVLGGFVLVAPRDRAIAYRGLAFATAAGAPFVVVLLVSYAAISGDPLVSPYDVWMRRMWPGRHLFGFGLTVWNYNHTVGVAIHKTIAVFLRMNLWAFGWPISLVGLLAAALGVGRDRAAKVILALVGAHVVAYFFYAFAAVHDLGSYYHAMWMPPLAALTARVIVELGRAQSGWSKRALPFALAMTAFGALTFWPEQASRLHFVASRVKEPIDEAARLAKANGRIVVFYRSMHPMNMASWVVFGPLPGPKLDDPVLWCSTGDVSTMARVVQRNPDRVPYYLGVLPDGRFRFERLDGR